MSESRQVKLVYHPKVTDDKTLFVEGTDFVGKRVQVKGARGAVLLRARQGNNPRPTWGQALCKESIFRSLISDPKLEQDDVTVSTVTTLEAFRASDPSRKVWVTSVIALVVAVLALDKAVIPDEWESWWPWASGFVGILAAVLALAWDTLAELP